MIALILSVVAFALLGLSTDAHALARLGVRPDAPARRFRRIVTWALLAVAFVAAVLRHGWVFGPVYWSGIVMLAAGLVFLALNLLPPSLRIKR
ncbi:DUF3325 family protein [Sphingomonas sp.]|uniref:DUF3325 family protein n=1 Tax=Sphingomonas sp. TaxID=28214 RepID=UPI002C7A83AE|nr:DUF3325 family protein [Sphingomonas sp.]HTG38022.1 DUF3325 family protein [Sphingomonas sp.]